MKTNAILLALLIFCMSLAGCISQTDGVADVNVSNEPLQVTLSDEQMDYLVNSTYNTVVNVDLRYLVLGISDINDTHHAILGTQLLNVGQFDAPAGHQYSIIEVNHFVKERSTENQNNASSQNQNNQSNGSSQNQNNQISETNQEWSTLTSADIKFYSFCGDFPKTQSSGGKLSTLPSQDCRVEVGIQSYTSGSFMFGSTGLDFEQFKDTYSDVYLEIIILIEPISTMD